MNAKSFHAITRSLTKSRLSVKMRPSHISRSCHPHRRSPPSIARYSSMTDMNGAPSRKYTNDSPLLFSDNEPEHFTPNNISDQEWEIRTGRAIYVLQQTLPEFFELGLVSRMDKDRAPAIAQTSSQHDIESIYSPNVRLVYTPPVALPSPLPRTLNVEGLPLYTASSVFIRHTMKTLYTDLHVELRKMTVQSPASAHPPRGERATHLHRREKSLFVGLCVTGTARVSGGPGRWDVDSTYRFSPLSGLVHTHTIHSIHPAPHQAVYDALRASLDNVLGVGGGREVSDLGR